jgi:two-component system, cell cycle sensor histidine kinase and response regulator CckA
MLSDLPTVLLVDDEGAVRRLLTHALAGCGYTVLGASNGEEALQLAAAHSGPIDLLVTDLRMPGVGGREVAARLRAVRPEIKILFLSGDIDDQSVNEPFLPKPFSMTTFKLTARQVLGR